MKLNKNGSALAMTMIVVLVFLIIMGTCLGIATSYQRRSLNEYARKQAYLNAVAVVDAIAGDLNNIKNVDSYLPSDNTTPRIITSVEFPTTFTNETGETFNIKNGNISGRIYYDSEEENNNVLYIEIVSTFSGMSETVTLKMRKFRFIWYKEEYSRNGKVIENA